MVMAVVDWGMGMVRKCNYLDEVQMVMAMILYAISVITPITSKIPIS